MGIKQEMPLTIVVYEDGSEEQARGYIWRHDRKYYFDKFAKGSRTVWVERFNQMHGTVLKSKNDIYQYFYDNELKGSFEENAWWDVATGKFREFKRLWAAQNLPRVITYKILDKDDDIYSFNSLVKILEQTLAPEDRAILDIWKAMREKQN